jgi:hypothetical protein
MSVSLIQRAVLVTDNLNTQSRKPSVSRMTHTELRHVLCWIEWRYMPELSRGLGRPDVEPT